VPIVLTSRADDVRARVASTALAQIFAHWRGVPGEPPVESWFFKKLTEFFEENKA
jgi:hypothetical protein